MLGRIWTSGAANTSRHGCRCRDPLAPCLRFSRLSENAGQGSRAATLGPPLGSQSGFSTEEVRSLGHLSQHCLHLRKISLNQIWGVAELRDESGNV